MKKIIITHAPRMIRFIIAGCISTTVSFSLLFILTEILGVWYLLSSTIAFIMTFAVSFTLHKFWTFKSREAHILRAQMVQSLVLAIWNIGLNALAMYILVDVAQIWYMLAQALTLAVIGSETYFMYWLVIFRSRQVISAGPHRQ